MNEELKERILCASVYHIRLALPPKHKNYQLSRDIIAATSFLPADTSIRNRLFYIRNDLMATKVCACGCRTILKDPTKMYFRQHALKIKAVQDKIKQTFLKNYGVAHPLQSKNIQDKIKKTCLKKYGVTNPSQAEEVKQKKIETCLKNHGVEYPSQSKDVLDKFAKIVNAKFYNTFFTSDRLQGLVIQLFTVEEYKGQCGLYKFKCTICGHEFESNIIGIPRCEKCNPKLTGQSQLELQLIDYIKSIYAGEIILKDREVLLGKELDIYLPELKLAVEFNGIYWHSEIVGGKDKTYHLNKTTVCANVGIKLIHIFEDELVCKTEIVQSHIKTILNMNKYKIDIAKCVVKPIDIECCYKFLTKYNLNGYMSSDIMLGVFYKNRLVSTTTFNKLDNNKFYINRFSTISNFQIDGALNKVLDYLKLNTTHAKIVYPINRRWYTNKLWQNDDFTLKTETEPSCLYLNGNYKIRLSKKEIVLENKINGLDEWENIQLNGYDRIWDCGTLIFMKEFKDDR